MVERCESCGCHRGNRCLIQLEDDCGEAYCAPMPDRPLCSVCAGEARRKQLDDIPY